jgi:hypothetical protein
MIGRPTGLEPVRDILARVAPTYRKRAIPQASRIAVALRYGCEPGGECAVRCPCGATGRIHWWRLYGGKPSRWVSFVDLELDHIHPEYLGGGSEPENLQLLCRRCNRSKGWA